ncbi:hypothetical protein Cgig2_019957 [Carnegiea gigantea]|uniref:Uncharacterized protein n=1 Tax=Carnegiea gigantea TaxID=171969 RepID=A0A9Q1GZZ1_9CARY|nr:hypothetical protein Cgig2_019957 [Carnegiea gigantea]
MEFFCHVDGDGLDFRFFDLSLRNSNSQHSILQRGLDLINLGILREAEAAEELAGAPFHTVPRIGLLLLLTLPLAADAEDVVALHLNLHLFLLNSGQISLEDVGLWSLPPVDPGVGERGCLGGCLRFGGDREGGGGGKEVGKGVPHVEREWVEDAASSPFEEAWNQRHCRWLSRLTGLAKLSELFCGLFK